MVGFVEGEGIEPTLKPSLTCQLPIYWSLPPMFYSIILFLVKNLRTSQRAGLLF